MCCHRRRPARNLEVTVFYDGVRYWCRPGKGCNVPKRRATIARILTREFTAGLSFIGLARKYGMTTRRVQAAVRRFVARHEGMTT